MKKLIYSLLILAVPALSFAGSSDFSYDKGALSDEFSQLDKVATYVEETNVSYSELSKAPIFKGNLELSSHIAVRPTFELSDMDWKAFAWGFLCCPIGVFLYMLPSRDKSSEEKTSFWIGVIASAVIGGLGGGGTSYNSRTGVQ
ncbi:MAG: hypothetical protein ACKVQB_03615 [Bacteroidia bacterium]